MEPIFARFMVQRGTPDENGRVRVFMQLNERPFDVYPEDILKLATILEGQKDLPRAFFEWARLTYYVERPFIAGTIAELRQEAKLALQQTEEASRKKS